MIPYARQSISEQDIEAVNQVLRSDFLTQGALIAQFETAVSSYCHAEYAVAVSHGTAALHLACLALDVGVGDRVWTSPNSFVASSNCALYCGAEINFVDIDPKTYNISLNSLKQKLIQAEVDNCLPKVLIPVHFSGQSCDMKEIKELSKHYGFAIIEDAAHALGAEFLSEKVGSCLYSDLTIFSFHPAKMITCGEGGMILTNRPELAHKMELFRSHGVTRNPGLMTEKSHGDWYYQQTLLGFNYRMTDFQAALGLSQLKRLDDFVNKRQNLAQRYNKKLSVLSKLLSLPWQNSDTQSSWHLYIIRLNLKSLTVDRKTVFDHLRQSGIGVHVHYIPIHTQPYYQDLGFKQGDFPESESYYYEAITLPLFVDLEEEQVDFITQTVEKLLLKFSKQGDI